MIYYIPGCDVSRNHPEAGRKAQDYMESRGIQTGQCCRKDVSYLKPGDTLITNCTQCDLIFAERVPQVKIMSTYEYLLNENFVFRNFHDMTMTLQDCWRKRNDPVFRNAVRRCLKEMHVTVRELPHNNEHADFCGVWLNNPAPEDCINAAPGTFRELEKYRVLLSPQEQKEKMETYVRGLPEGKTAVYCNGCEKGIRLGGGDPVHMIEMLFGI